MFHVHVNARLGEPVGIKYFIHSIEQKPSILAHGENHLTVAHITLKRSVPPLAEKGVLVI